MENFVPHYASIASENNYKKILKGFDDVYKANCKKAKREITAEENMSAFGSNLQK